MTSRRQFIQWLGISPLAFSSEAKGTTGFLYDDLYLKHEIRPDHPESPGRLGAILAEMERQGLDAEVTKIPRAADPKDAIRTYHTPKHVDAIQRIPVTGDVAEAAVSGIMSGVDAVSERRVKNAFCALRPPGHHANNTGAEEGFCYYSNVGIAARHAQSKGFEKVLIIDWDYHHGNATQNAFYDDPSVLFYSSHDWEAYPQTGDPSQIGEGDGRGLNVNVHLECGSKDVNMLSAWDRKLLPAVSEFKPDFVLISAGFDSRKDDTLGCFEVTDDAFYRMTRTAMDVANDYCDGRVVSVLEGGYNLEGLAKAACAHVRALVEG